MTTAASLETRREDCHFVSGGIRCEGWLYRPWPTSPQAAPPQPMPLVVMAHGFAAERRFGLPAYAEQFASRGIAVLLFDYRHFGGSEGEPRELVDPGRQQQDWLAAVDYASSLAWVDPRRIGLWGSSFSGGHVVATAAHRPSVAAVSSQAPMLDVPASLRVGVGYVARAFVHALRDQAGAWLGRRPHYIPVVAPPDKFAALNQSGCESGYGALVPPEAEWRNRCTARTLLHSLWFRPGGLAASVGCPVLLVIAQQDQVIRAKAIERVASKFPDVDVRRYQADHFQIYQGALGEEIRQLQADFFCDHLCHAERCRASA